jgi:hypothetical protein
VEINLDVLGTLVLNNIGKHVDNTDAITINKGGTAKRSVKLLQELAQPSGLCNSISHCTILGFST